MKSVPLKAYPRSLARRRGAKQLRSGGRIPAVIYGRKAQPQNLELVQHELEDLIHHAPTENLLLDLSVDTENRPKRLALVQQVQHHPLSGHILHVDLHEIDENEQVTVTVPVEAVGECAGVKNGGILEHVLFKLRVRALPKDLPEVVNVEVSHLEIGQSVHIADITPPAGVQILGDKNISVFSVAAPITEAQEQALAEAAAAAAGEVEMIKEKKEGEEGAPAPAAKGEKAEKAEGKAEVKPGKVEAKPGEKAPAAAAVGEKKPAEKKK